MLPPTPPSFFPPKKFPKTPIPHFTHKNFAPDQILHGVNLC